MRLVRLAVVCLGLATLAGCAATRSEVTPDVKTVENPTSGIAVRIDKVEDVRVFRLDPPQPHMPSLSDGAINNPATTSRAFARKRGGYGLALGDVLLPPGQTVADLMHQALETGFRKAGYRVIPPGHPEHSQAIPVTARIKQYWAWFTPGFMQVTLSCRSEVELHSELSALKGGTTVRSEISEGMGAVFEEDWRKMAGKGLDDVSLQTELTLLKRR